MSYEWVIIDTETTGLSSPIHVVEIAAQKMSGMEIAGEPFSCLINHQIEIPDSASRIHGYTKDILERDGLLPEEAYEKLKEVVEDRYVVAYNLPYDWDQVLINEWERLGINQIGRRGFCALKLVRRLLDPVPTGNCKLQTLRRYYGLPERAAHSAKGDVLTVVDLFEKVLFPLAKDLQLTDLSKIASYAEEKWYPSTIQFGKHKGRDFREAKNDEDLFSYLEWLESSDNPRSSDLGSWYLNNLDQEVNYSNSFFDFEPDDANENLSNDVDTNSLTKWVDPEIEKLNLLIESARLRLAKLETEFSVLKSKVDQTRLKIFKALRPLYEKEELLLLKIEYRKTFLDTLIREGEEGTQNIENEFKEAEKEKNEKYSKTEDELSSKRKLGPEDEKRLEKIWKKLVVVFHPDRFANDPDKQKKYEKLTSYINEAKEEGDLDTLEKIASDPEGFAVKKGLGDMDLSDSGKQESEKMKRLLQALQSETFSVLEGIQSLKENPEYELFIMSEKDISILENVISRQRIKIEENIKSLEEEADKLLVEIQELTGESFLE